MKKALKIVLISLGVFFVIIIIGAMYLGANSPDTCIYTEYDIPAKYRKQVKSLSLLSEDEKIIFLYSDAFLDIADGLYMLTNEHLTVYLAEWDEPELIIEFSEIDFIDIEYDDSFLTDSYVTVETEYGLVVEFPVSSEKGRDHDFFDYLQKKVEKSH